jgi:cell division protein FtsL
MDEPRVEELLHRIETLEREKRRWKVIGIGSLSILLVIVLLGGLFSVATAVMMQAQHARALQAEQEALMRAMDAEQARQEAMRERDVAERARSEALAAEQRARQEAEKKAKEDGR